MEVLGYDLTKDNSDFVEEGYEKVSTIDYLYTTNLYSCVAIYAISGDFKYLGHILVLDRRNEFINGKTDKIYILFDELLKRKEDLNDIVFVGLVYGVGLDGYQNDKYNVISDDLEEVINKLVINGINIERLDDLTSENLLINGVDKTIEVDEDTIDLSVVPTI